MSGKGSKGDGWVSTLTNKYTLSAVALLAVAVSYLRFSNSNKKVKYYTKKKRRGDRTGAGGRPEQKVTYRTPEIDALNESAEVKVLPDDKGLNKLLQESFENLQGQGGDQAQFTFLHQDDLLEIARQLTPDVAVQYTANTRIQLAKWVLLFYSAQLGKCEAEAQVNAVLKVQDGDMETAWHLLNVSTADSEELADMAFFKLDCAQRLKSPERIAETFDFITNNPDGMSPRDMMVCFSAAPLLGRWKDTVRLAAGFAEKQGVSLEQMFTELHYAALDSIQPDLGVLHEFACAEVDNGNEELPLSDIQWREFDITKLQVKLVDLSADTEELKAHITKNYGSGSWSPFELDAQRKRIVRCGGYTMMSSHHMPVPVNMVGPSTDKSIKLKGYIDLDPTNPFDERPNPGNCARYQEQWDVKCISEDDDITHWSGRCEMSYRQGPGSSASIQGFTFTLEVAMDVLEDRRRL
jgi:hypothetical protein